MARWDRRAPMLLIAVLGLALLTGAGRRTSTPAAARPEISADGAGCARTFRADVVALDQVYTYNRFGAFNPTGQLYALSRDVTAIDPGRPLGPGNVRLRDGKRPRPLVLRVGAGDCLEVRFTNWLAPSRDELPPPPELPFRASSPLSPPESPFTRTASFHVTGLEPLELAADGSFVGRNPSSLAAPGETTVHRLRATREGTFLVRSMGALAGGEGDGGSLAQGLFGAIHVEPAGSSWYRSQVTADELAAATIGRNPDGTPRLDFEALGPDGVPVLRMVTSDGELVHADLTAIVSGYAASEMGTRSVSLDRGAFREFTVLFHDELPAVQAFPRLDTDPAMHGVRDGFGINYGAAGLGAMLLANRQKLGPARGCVECRFEEFFLSSWVGGDPALNVELDADGRAIRALYPDDPSNVVHAYLGDAVRIRNLHAGPKEHHVFHLHAHQWLQSPAGEASNYLDSQNLGPGSGFTYDLAYGGAGNRNLTPGDSIFHCHLYPHFAQGMWALMRVHDVFEAGTPDRNLPDGEIEQGTPTPAVVPLPAQAMPPMPTYEETTVTLADGAQERRPAMPGFPHYVAGRVGHRPPQPPLDLVHDGGLGRHVITGAPDHAVILGRRGEFDVELEAAELELLPPDGTPAERAAMEFHGGRFAGAAATVTSYGVAAQSYTAFTPEGANAAFVVNGRPPAPGAPFADPCPAGAPVRTFRAAQLQLDLVVNRDGWHDPQARIEVLEDDLEDTLSGRRPPEPLFVRARSGDCIVFQTTNLLPGALDEDDFQLFTPTDSVGQHIHLVKFDVTASDGGANGFNYEDGTFAADEVRARIAAANAAGGALGSDGARRTLAATVHPLAAATPGAQSTVQRWWADPLVGAGGGDRTLRTVFTHDHLSPSSHQQHGLYAGLLIEPADSRWRDPSTGEALGTRSDGGPTSFAADVLTGTSDAESFREFALQFSDFALLYDARGAPVNPPTAREAPLPLAIEHPPGVVRPEAISTADPGSMLLNYRNEPLPLRLGDVGPDGAIRQRSDAAGAMENVFRSPIHGDPVTPLLRAYEGDRVELRILVGAQEEGHSVGVSGQRWLAEPSDPDSGWVAAQPVGLSEHVEFVLGDGLPAVKSPWGTADFLYGSLSTDDLWNGLWGLMRTYGDRQADLLPLPNNRPRTVTATGDPCPAGAPLRAYKVHAIAARGNLPGDRLVYNARFSLYDPDAILFVRSEDLAAVRAGTRAPEPLILRAAAGECVQVLLVNELPPSLEPLPHFSYLPPITEGFNVNQVRPSSHVSLHPQLLTYDVNTGDGATVGHNLVQTVAPRTSGRYRWYAGRHALDARGQNLRAPEPIEFGAVGLVDLADVVHHPRHGAFGALVIEPAGASWSPDPGTHAIATVRYPDASGILRSFRELVLVAQDDVPLHSDDPRFACTNGSLRCGSALANLSDDAEDSGHRAYNYRTEPLWARLGLPPEAVGQGILNDHELSALLSSPSFGDPATPVMEARPGDAVRIRVVQPSGHARQHGFELHGASFARNAWAAGTASRRQGRNLSPVIDTQSGITARTAANLLFLQPAGGGALLSGDRLYRNPGSFTFTDGQWGLLRVLP